jgi:hypothetical protein
VLDVGIGAGVYAVLAETSSREFWWYGQDERWICGVFGRAEAQDGLGGAIKDLERARI